MSEREAMVAVQEDLVMEEEYQEAEERLINNADDKEESDVESIAESITNLIDLDNISTHNLYLSPERLGSSNLRVSDVDDDQSSVSSRLTTSTATAAGADIDYSALDRFGFIVLGDNPKDTGGETEEERAFRKKQYGQGNICLKL